MYCWCVRQSLESIGCKWSSILANSRAGSLSQLGSNLHIGPANTHGPTVGPSRCATKWRSGSSFASSWHMNQWTGGCNVYSTSRIIPPVVPVLTAIPSQPITVISLSLTTCLTIQLSIAFVIALFDPPEGTMRPKTDEYCQFAPVSATFVSSHVHVVLCSCL